MISQLITALVSPLGTALLLWALCLLLISRHRRLGLACGPALPLWQGPVSVAERRHGTVRTGDGSEAEAMRQFLLDLGVPGSAIWLEQDSQNTAANAERTGLQVDPAPTDFEVIPMPLDLQSLLPDAGALNGSARAMKEVVWRWVGR